MKTCRNCGGAILERNQIYMYSGKVCPCPVSEKFQDPIEEPTPSLFTEVIKTLEDPVITAIANFTIDAISNCDNSWDGGGGGFSGGGASGEF